MRVQLAVPPNAPGEEQFLEVGLFRVSLRDPALGRGASGETLVRVSLELEPPETRTYRLDPQGLVELTSAPVPEEVFARRDDPVVSEAGISDPHARWVTHPPGRIVALGSPGTDGAAGRIEVVQEAATSAGRPLTPPLSARAGCSPTPLALAERPLRVAWLDCQAPEPGSLLDRLRVSVLSGEEWITTPAPVDLLALGASADGAEPHLEARFVGSELLALVARHGDGAGAVVGVANGAWRLRATLPEVRVGRAGPPVLGDREGELLAAWHEPSLDGAQVVLRRALRDRWPLVGRGGVDTRLPGAMGLAPAVGWDGGDPLVAVSEPGGLSVLRWNGDDWRRWGGRVDEAAAVTDVGLAERGGQVLVAWAAGGQVWTAERSVAGWLRSEAPLAEGARAMRIAGAGRVSALAWLDGAGGIHARTRGRRDEWRPEVALEAGAPGDALDVSVGARRAFVAVRTGGSALRVFRVGEGALDLGAPPQATGAAAFAVSALGSGQALLGWVSADGVALARRDETGWTALPCASARGLGPSVDALDLALHTPAGALMQPGDGTVWLAARQSRPARHVRVVRCAVP
jgi:hypothetical protein